MGNFLEKAGRLFDPITKAFVGVLDSIGREQLVPSYDYRGLTVSDSAILSPAALAAAAALGQAVAPPELQPLDWWPDRFFTGDAQYLYGHDAANALNFVRMDRVTRARVVTANPFGVSSPRVIRAIYASPTTQGRLFCVVGEASQTASSMVVWKSNDYGATWTNVLTLGTANGQSINGIWCLSDRNICEVNGIVYIGEYNVNNARVDGGTNDQVVIWQSTTTDANAFTPAVVFNTSGHQIRHIHSLKPTPSGRILILTGDTDAESAFILWDRKTSISNVPLTANYPVPIQFGDQRRRAVEALLHTDGYWYYMSDGDNQATNTVGDVGWLRVPEFLDRAPTRLDGKISAIPKRDVYFAAQLSNGCAIYIEELTGTPAAGGFNLGIWATNEDRSRIERTGVQLLSTATTGAVAPHMFQIGDVVFVSTIAGFGKGGAAGTASFTMDPTRRWNGVREDVIYPVYWVDPVNGTDDATSERGYRPSLPWKTLKYCLESNRAPQGGRILLPAGDFEETITADIAVNADQTNAETAGFLTIEGRGVDLTKHSAAAASTRAQTYALGVDANAGFEFKDIWISTKRDVSTQAIFNGSGATSAQRLRFIRARAGGRDLGPANQNVVLNSNLGAAGSLAVTLYDSQFVALATGSAYLVSGTANGPVNITAYRSVFDGGRGAANPLSTDTIYAEDSLFCNYAVAAFRSGAAATVIPRTLRSRFSAGTPNGAALPQYITDNGALTPAGQFVAARSTTALNPSALFDSTSAVYAPAAPRDPKVFDYRQGA